MSYETTGHYFGSYLEIRVREQMLIDSLVTICGNGHKASGKFCGECGSETKEQAIKSMRYPTMICGWLLDDEWEGVLSEKTPPKLSATGVILAVSESLTAIWLELNEYGEGVQVKPFPTPDKVKAMKEELEASCADIIKALKESEDVISVEIKAGYVLDMEY